MAKRAGLKQAVLSAAAWGSLILVNRSLALLGYRRTCAVLIRLSPHPPDSRVDVRRAMILGRLVNRVAARHSKDINCIRRSLALWWLLRWLRLPSRMRFGMRPDTGHTWVEHGGQIVNDRWNVADDYPIVLSDELIPETMAAMER